MKICIIGTGYVGLTTGACFAELGNRVICIDRDKERISRLKKGIMPIYEKGLGELVKGDLSRGNLEFDTDIRYGVAKSDVVFIAVGTPSLPDGDIDLSDVKSAVKEIAGCINGYKIIVIKSTVPVGTQKMVVKLMGENMDRVHSFDVVSNPEFLREGSALSDSMHPDRVVIGADNRETAREVARLYRPMQCRIVFTSPESAEMIKYASNAFLAVKVSYINEIANLCEMVGADIAEVAEGMGLDGRIGRRFLNAGIGYGGSCFPKDTRAIAKLARREGRVLQVIESAIRVNERQRFKPVEKLAGVMKEMKGKTVGVLGLAFKPDTDDIREAPSIDIINRVQGLGARVKAYDPIAMPNAARILRGVEYCNDPYETAEGADALILVTEWDEFKGMDLERIRRVLRRPVFIDGRNVFDPDRMMALGFEYYCIGS